MAAITPKIELILVAVERRLFDAWSAQFEDLDFVSVELKSIFEIQCDAVVSPANSFGFMDGGIDAQYTSFFGRGVQERLQKKICDEFDGELLVGQACAVPTEDPGIPWLIAAPTMRVPMKLFESVNVYLATRALLLLLKKSAEELNITRIACPGMGTGVGGVPSYFCARQMRKAVDEVLLGKWTFPASWAEASERHQLLYGNELRRLQ